MDDDSLLGVRAINAYTFCPRLFWLEHVEGVFEANAHTVQGAHVHRRVDKPGGAIPAPSGASVEDVTPEVSADDEAPPWHARSLWLSAADLGVSGKLDLVEEDGGVVTPVDTKKGRPTAEGGLWAPDEVQLTLQALLLRASGYQVERVAAWYHETRQRVSVPLTEAMEARAREQVAAARACARGRDAPPPLVDAPQCGGCSLVGVCLPDEVGLLGGAGRVEGDAEIRRLIAPRDDGLPLYVQANGARVGVRGGRLRIVAASQHESEVQEVGLGTVSQVNIFGSSQITTQALQACLKADIPVSFFSFGGWYYGRTEGMGSRQVTIRIAQFGAHGQGRALALARVLIADKIANQRTLIRRNAEGTPEMKQVLRALRGLQERAGQAEEAATLLGLEGDAARRYWAVFSALTARSEDAFAMQGRNRRPPRDRTNALLSFGYALLVKDCTLACLGAGLDPYLGMYHTAHHGRPSLALDLMEPFRPLIVDSVVLQMISRGEVRAGDFIAAGQAVAMKPRARKALIEGYERRMDELITHPVFGYRISYRRVLSVQARLMARVLTQEIPELPSFRTR